MDLIKDFHKRINEKNVDDETKKNYKKLVYAIFAPACEARCNTYSIKIYQLKEENNRLLKNLMKNLKLNQLNMILVWIYR